jgi:hypothetical protein
MERVRSCTSLAPTPIGGKSSSMMEINSSMPSKKRRHSQSEMLRMLKDKQLMLLTTLIRYTRNGLLYMLKIWRRKPLRV